MTNDPGTSRFVVRDSDPIDRPAHYTQGSVECIDALEAALGPEQFTGYLRGCVIKYTWRMWHKKIQLKMLRKLSGT